MTMHPERPLSRDELVGTGSEREVLEAFLDMYRDIVVAKVTCVSTEAARCRLVSSSTTLVGLVKHLSSVERDWFRGILEQRPAREVGVHVADDGWGVGQDETVEELIADYQRACAESRKVAGRFSLEDSVPMARLGRVSLRWISVHLIEETARHAGHADILREQTDGATGFDG
jgi:uncharacterized damage-inducible protein DinB